MGKKIVFGQDLIDVLENKYKLNRITEYPTKYKNGIVENNYFYGKVKTLDDLKYGKPYLYFVVDDETDGFVSGELFLDGYEGIQFDSYDDIKYFMDNAKWTESKKFVRKSLKEGIDVKIVYADDTPSEYIDDVTHNDILDIIEESPEVYKIFDVSGSKKKLVWSDEYGFERAYESKKSARKSIKESKDLTDLCNSWVIGDAVGKFKNRDYCHKGNDYSVFNIGNIIEDALRDNYILEFDGDNKAKSVIFYMVDKDGKNVGSLEIYPDERYEISNYEDGYDLSKLDMDEIADLFYEFQNNKIEYLLSDKRFDFTDKFWCNESKKSTRKSLKEGINDELIATSYDGEITLYLSDERQANHGKDPHYEFKLGENGYFTRYVRCDDNRCENVVLDWIKEFNLDISKSEISKIIKLHESKKSVKKSLKESVDGYIATDEDCNMSGKGWVLDGSYNFIMEFLQEWGIAPKDVKVKNAMTTLFNADGNPFGYVYQDEEVDIFVADKTTNWTWENHNPSTKRVKVTALDEIF